MIRSPRLFLLVNAIAKKKFRQVFLSVFSFCFYSVLSPLGKFVVFVRANSKYPFFTRGLYSVCYRLFIYLFINSFVQAFLYSFTLTHVMNVVTIFFIAVCTICVSFIVDSLLFKPFLSLSRSPFCSSSISGLRLCSYSFAMAYNTFQNNREANFFSSVFR